MVIGSQTIILHIETGGDDCSVALSGDGMLLGLKESINSREHSKLLSVLIDELLLEKSLRYKDLSAIALSKGPGSYTGLRIGTSTAKGLCYGLDIPLIAIDSLVSLTQLCRKPWIDALYCPMIDARRLEVYTAIFDGQMKRVSETEAKILDENSFSEILEHKKIVFFGSGTEKCKTMFKNPNAVFEDVRSSAVGLITPAYEAFIKKEFENTAYFEPLYLKDFVVTTKKK